MTNFIDKSKKCKENIKKLAERVFGLSPPLFIPAANKYAFDAFHHKPLNCESHT
ncbi:MAG TPA: hypothetical protein GX706_00525 [Candidatus Moranbacteria bacterium]|nr:hypothetical protein [Candidatus Moranbacteria bacterium]